MKILDFLKEVLFPEKKGAELIKDERDKIKNDIAKNFKEQLNFTDLEIKEILDIVTLAETDIAEIKRGLTNVNINNPNTEKDVQRITKQINDIGIQMSEDIKKKAQEIMQRKKLFRANKNDWT